MKRQFLVTLEMPHGALVADICEYVQDAVQSWKGQLHPDDPLFNLDYKTVKVKPLYHTKATPRKVK